MKKILETKKDYELSPSSPKSKEQVCAVIVVVSLEGGISQVLSNSSLSVTQSPRFVTCPCDYLPLLCAVTQIAILRAIKFSKLMLNLAISSISRSFWKVCSPGQVF